MTLVAVSVGALSKPGVEIGIGKQVEPVPFAQKGRALDDHVVAGRLVHDAGRDGVRDRVVPFRLDLRYRGAHADAVDGAVGGDGADHDGDVVFAAVPVMDVGEEERLALGLVQPADELPAHQRVQLGILVDRPVDGQEKSRLPERRQMLVQIGVETVRIAQ